MLRFAEIIYVLLLHLLFYRLHPRFRRENFGARVRLACERLGVVFVKLGQSLASRRYFSGSVQAELDKLYGATKPLSFDVIRYVVESEFGKPLEAAFESFDQVPLASASIAQVHRAKYRGCEAAVKVLRPGVLGQVREDMRILRFLIGIFSIVSRRVRSIRSARIPDQIEKWLFEETDLRNEAKNIEIFRHGYPKASFILPEVLYASRTILIDTFLEGGLPLGKWTEADRARGYHPERAILRFLDESFEPPFFGEVIPELGYLPIHADPHLENLLLLPDGRIGVVDLGLIGRVKKRELDLLDEVIFAVYGGDEERAVKGILRICKYRFPSDKRQRAFERDVALYIDECPHQPFSYWLLELGRILTSHGVPAPEVFGLICRFGVLADSVAQKFFPGSSTFDLVGGKIRAGIEKHLLERILSVDWLPIVEALVTRLEEMPRDAARAVKDPLGTIADAVDRVVTPLRSKAA